MYRRFHKLSSISIYISILVPWVIALKIFYAPCVCPDSLVETHSVSDTSLLEYVCINDPVYVTYLKIKILSPYMDNSIANEAAKAIARYSKEYELDPEIILAVITAESDWDINAVSSTGATGLMQVMPFWIDALQYGKNLKDPEIAIKYGSRILKTYSDMYAGRLQYALAAYNQGPNLVDREIDAGKSTWQFSDTVLKIYKRIQAIGDIEDYRDPYSNEVCSNYR